jgi:hypothetical protein
MALPCRLGARSARLVLAPGQAEPGTTVALSTLKARCLMRRHPLHEALFTVRAALQLLSLRLIYYIRQRQHPLPFLSRLTAHFSHPPWRGLSQYPKSIQVIAMARWPWGVRCALLVTLAVLCPWAAGLPDVPAPENFVRRMWARVTVLGDYVYVDGGQLTQKVDGKLWSTVSDQGKSPSDFNLSRMMGFWMSSNHLSSQLDTVH